MVEESHVKSKKHTEANFLFVPFERYNLSEGMNPYALLKKMDEDVPHVSYIFIDKELYHILFHSVQKNQKFAFPQNFRVINSQ